MNLPQLLDNLNSRDASLREDAERRLRALSPDELMQFAQLEQAQFRRWADKEMFKLGVRAVSGALLVGVSIALFFIWLHRLYKLQFGPVLTPVSLLIMGVMFARYRFKLPCSRDVLIAVIREKDDVRFVPFLLTMGDEPRNERATEKAIVAALVQLLPRLCTGQADDWTFGHKRKLLWHLTFTISHFERNMATLKALEQIGGAWAIPAVAKCAGMETKINSISKPFNMTYEAATERARQLKQAAQECLPFLEQRQQEAKQSQTLLRASALVTPTDTLLRPVAPVVQEEGGEQLLRPSADK